MLAGTTAMRPAPTGVTADGTGSARPSASSTPGATTSGSFRKIISPDLLVIEPSGLSARQLAKLSAAAGVRQVVSADGAAIKLNGHQVNVLGVNPGQFRVLDPAGHRDGSAPVDRAAAGPLRDLGPAGRAAQAAPGHGST